MLDYIILGGQPILLDPLLNPQGQSIQQTTQCTVGVMEYITESRLSPNLSKRGTMFNLCHKIYFSMIHNQCFAADVLKSLFHTQK
jgi:hypothetical protein